MSYNSGPKFTTDGLQLYFDLSNSKSYVGKPTKNQIAQLVMPYANTNGTYIKGSGGTERAYIPALRRWVNTTYMNFWNDYPNSGDCCSTIFQYSNGVAQPASGSQLYTYSLLYKSRSGYYNPNYMYHYEFNGGTYLTEYGLFDGNKRTDLGDGWYHAYNTFTTNASCTIMYTGMWHYEYNVYNKISIAAVNMIEGDYRLSPNEMLSIAETRTNTQGLFDLTRNHTIDLTNAEYDSFGKIKFVNAGSNCKFISVDGSPFAMRAQNEYTRVAWFYMDSIDSAWSPVVQNSIGNNSDMGLTVYSDGKLHFRQYTNTYTNGTTSGDYGVSGTQTLSTGRWYMGAIAVSRTAKTVTFYLNGALDSTSTTNEIGISNSNDMRIGCTNDDFSSQRKFRGIIGSVWHYGRVLTAAEMLQLYNSTRRIYGL